MTTGWDGDRLTLTERHLPGGSVQRIHTVYEPGSFVPLLRIETGAQPPAHTLANLWTQDSGARPDERQQALLGEVEKELRQGVFAAYYFLNLETINEKQRTTFKSISWHLHAIDGDNSCAASPFCTGFKFTCA